MVWRVLLLSAWLCFSLASTQGHVRQERPWERREEDPDTALLGNEHYEKLQSHLGTVRALSRRYWHFLACRMWQEGCEEEKKEQEVVAATQQEEEKEEEEEEEEGNKVILEHQGWSLPIVTEMVSNWYCSFGKCCATGDCRVINNITGLDLDLSRRLHGQHLVKHVVLKAIQGFLETPEPEKALTLSFHGWTGTGKNFVARMIAEHLYQDGLKSDCVKVFISLFHFPHSKYVDIYKVQLSREISETVQLCEQSLFIFDEAEKLHAGLLDAIKPYVDHYDSINAVNYRRSIFLFLSNTGANIINEVALDFWRTGRAREEIAMEFLEPYLRTELMEATVNPLPNGSWWKKTEVTARKPRMSYTELFSAPVGSFKRTHNVSHAEEQGLTDKDYTYNGLLGDNLIDFLVPFLPLEYRHVKLCARDAFLARGLPFTEEALDEVARMMVFVPKEEKLFSAQGCKSVSQRINYFIP